MLSSEVSWLADGYKSKVDKEEVEPSKRNAAPAGQESEIPKQQKYPKPLMTSGQTLVRKSWSARLRPPKKTGVTPSQTRPPATRARSAPSGWSRSRLRPGSAVRKVSQQYDSPSLQPEVPITIKADEDATASNLACLTTTSTASEDDQQQQEQQHPERPLSFQNSSLQSTIDLYTQPLANRNVKNAAFRLYIYHSPAGSKDGMTPSDILSPASRPCSGRMRVARSAARPLGKPRSAWEAENEADKELWYPLNIASNGVHPSPAESETNLADWNLPAFRTSADSDKMLLQNTRRPQSSFSDRAAQGNDRLRHGGDTVKRPVSCDARIRRQERGGSSGGLVQTGRVESTSSVGHSRATSGRRSLSPACHYSPAPIPGRATPTPGSRRDYEEDRWDDGFVEDGDDELRVGSPWLEDPRIGLSVGFEPDPRLLYFDQRHARCLSHSGHSYIGASSSSTQHQTQHPLMMWHSPTAGKVTQSLADTRSLSSSINNAASSGGRPTSRNARRPWSSTAAMTRPSNGQARRYYSSTQRYVDVHRPKTAPSTVNLRYCLSVYKFDEWIIG